MTDTRTIHELYPDEPEAAALIAELDAELSALYPGFPIHGLTADEMRSPTLRFLVIKVDGVPVGCGAIRRLSADIAELKRMYVKRSHRRQGLARAILEALEERALRDGIRRLRLESGDGQPEAVALYRSAGYADIPSFADYIDHPGSICLEKELRRPA